MTEPYHAIVNRISQHRSKIFYQYQEQDASGLVFSWLSTVCALWVTLWSYVSTPSWDVVGRAPVSLPLDLSVRKEEEGSRSRTMKVVVPPPKEGSKITPDIGTCISKLGFVFLCTDPNSLVPFLLQSPSPNSRSSYWRTRRSQTKEESFQPRSRSVQQVLKLCGRGWRSGRAGLGPRCLDGANLEMNSHLYISFPTLSFISLELDTRTHTPLFVDRRPLALLF